MRIYYSPVPTPLLRPLAISQEKRMRRRPWRRSFFSHLVLILSFLPLILFLCLSLLWVAFLGADVVPRVKRSADLPLRFRSDGSFKILQVIDICSSIHPRNSTIATFSSRAVPSRWLICIMGTGWWPGVETYCHRSPPDAPMSTRRCS